MAARFWVGGTGNWDAADTTHWAATSGGSGGETVPGASDTVTFDGASGGGTVTVTADHSVTSVTGGAFTGTLDYGSGRTITYGTFSYTGTATRGLTLGDANITLTASTATVWNISTATNLTLSAASSTITSTGSNVTFASAGAYGTLVFSGATDAKITLGTSCVNFTRTGTAAKTDTLMLGTGINLTVSGTFTVTGNSPINRVLVWGQTLGVARTITAATVVVDKADFQDITGAGAASWDMSAAAGYTGDCGGNSMKSLGAAAFTAATTQTATGTSSFTWSTHGWTSRVPLPQDDVVIPNAFSASQTVTLDMPRLGKSIDLTGCTGSPALTHSSGYNVTIFGGLIGAAGVLLSGSQTFVYTARANSTITYNGLTHGIVSFTPTNGVTITVTDAALFASTTTYGGGQSSSTLTFQGNVTISTAFTMNNSGFTRTLNMGSGTWTFNATTASTVFNIIPTSGVTINGGSATIVIGTTSANTRTINIGPSSQTLGTLTYTLTGSTGEFDLAGGSNSFAAINFSDPSNARSLKFTAGTTTTIRNANGFNVFGTTGKNMTVDSITAANHTLTSSNQQAGNIDYLTLGHSVVDASPKWYAGANSTDGGTNTNWLFTALSSGGTSTNFSLLGVG